MTKFLLRLRKPALAALFATAIALPAATVNSQTPPITPEEKQKKLDELNKKMEELKKQLEDLKKNETKPATPKAAAENPV